MTHNEEIIRKVLTNLDQDGLVNLAVEMGNLASPKGREKEIGDFIYQWLANTGFQASKQEVVPGRFNVIGRLPGQGGGRTLIFNSHMDTAQWGPEDVWTVGDEKPFYNHAWVEDGKVVGAGVVNDKGPMAAFMMAAKAILDSGVKLKGDLLLTMVVGEIGQAPIDEFQGPRYLGKGIGAKHLVDHGVWGDCALVAETTNFALTWAEAGDAWFKITVGGTAIYTPYLARPYEAAKHPNAIVKMTKVVEAIEVWALQYEEKNRYEFGAGVMIPKVNIGAIRAGLPFNPISSPGICSIYVDVRITPSGDPLAVQGELEKLLAGLGIEADIKMYLFKRGFEGKNIELLKSAIEKAHYYVFKEALKPVAPPVTSMWRDINAFNAAGIPAITYGPGAGVGRAWGGPPYLTVEDLATASKLYALIALDVCNQDKGRVYPSP